MSTPTEPSRSREHTGTYFVQDRGNVEELQRLQIQDRLVTESMGECCQSKPTRRSSSGCSMSAAAPEAG